MEPWEEKLQNAQCVLVGLGKEWERAAFSDYGNLAAVLKDRNYFIVTLNTDGNILKSSLSSEKITAPCGNRHWYQCEDACTKDIWEEGEVPEEICPHCGKPLVPNTIETGHYIEEGYLPSWKEYTEWLSRTLNRRLFVLELGTDFSFPGIIRWPFEKTAFFNQKACFLRVNESFPQISEELSGRAFGIRENSLKWIQRIREEKK